MSTERKPWLVKGVPWKTEAAFWGWIRGVLRKGWSRHPVKIEYIKAHRKRIVNPNLKASARFPEVWGMTCEICQKDHVQGNIEIDHIADKGASLTCREDIQGFAEHLFLVSFKCLRAVCKECHRIVSHAQSKGVSFKEAALQKRIIEFISQDKDIVLAYLSEREYSGAQVSNASKRRLLVETIMRGEQDEQVD